jgi:MFS family permease
MKVYEGWVVVAAGFVATCVGFGAMLSLAVFLQPIAQSTGWSRGEISTAALLNWLFMGVGSFLWGALSDRFGARVVIVLGGGLVGLGFVAGSQAATLLQFQVVFGVTVGLAAAAFYAPLASVTTGWFTRHRSLAVALVSAGLSAGTMTMGPLARWLISSYDWRTAMLVIGDVVWLVVIPAALLVRTAPPAIVSAGAAPAAGADVTAAQALRSPQLAAIALTHFACCAAHSGPIFHMVTHVIDYGIAPMTAVTVLSTAGLASLSGRVLCGLVADRVGAKRTLVAGLVVQAVAVGLYLFARELTSFYALALLFGLSYGGVMPLYPILVREYFGHRIMGTAFGAVAFVSTLGMALGPLAGGWLYDASGTYVWLFAGSAGIGAGAVAIALTFRRPRELALVSVSP